MPNCCFEQQHPRLSMFLIFPQYNSLAFTFLLSDAYLKLSLIMDLNVQSSPELCILGIYRVDILHTEVVGHNFLNGPTT